MDFSSCSHNAYIWPFHGIPNSPMFCSYCFYFYFIDFHWMFWLLFLFFKLWYSVFYAPFWSSYLWWWAFIWLMGFTIFSIISVWLFFCSSFSLLNSVFLSCIFYFIKLFLFSWVLPSLSCLNISLILSDSSCRNFKLLSLGAVYWGIDNFGRRHYLGFSWFFLFMYWTCSSGVRWILLSFLFLYILFKSPFFFLWKHSIFERGRRCSRVAALFFSVGRYSMPQAVFLIFLRVYNHLE